MSDYSEHLISMAGGDGEPEPLDLDAIQARADAATEGPWRLWVDQHAPESHRGAAVESAWAYDDEGLDTEMITDWCETPDAEFIANARTDVPALLALVREQQARIVEVKAAALREAAEHFKTRSEKLHNTMKEMTDSREYGIEDIVRYGAYSAEANTTATWLRTQAAKLSKP